jgi:hypothetical protein
MRERNVGDGDNHNGSNRHASRAALLLLLSLSLLSPAHAAAPAPSSGSSSGGASAAGIYTCVDAHGRTLTADRPIAECIDREQLELGPSGIVRRHIEPPYTPRELAEREARAREAAALAARITDQRRRERALLVRYPNPAAHNHERSEALAQIDAVKQAALTRLSELAEERKKIDEELEFYKKDPTKAPPPLRRQLDDNTQSVNVQNRFISEQEAEKKRVNERFDEERSQLTKLWSQE